MPQVNQSRQGYMPQPLKHLDKYNAPQQAPKAPQLVSDTLSLNYGSAMVASSKDVSAKARTSSAAEIGKAVAEGSHKLHKGGYKYPPNLSDKYYHKPGKVGCCADFVADSYAEAAKALSDPTLDIGSRMKNLPAPMNNPHQCPSMIQFFQKEETLLKASAKPQVGDVVFFDWDGNGAKDPDHVAIVSKVNKDGSLEIIDSRKFNQPTQIDTMKSGDPRFKNVVGYGRLKEAPAKVVEPSGRA